MWFMWRLGYIYDTFGDIIDILIDTTIALLFANDHSLMMYCAACSYIFESVLIEVVGVELGSPRDSLDPWDTLIIDFMHTSTHWNRL